VRWFCWNVILEIELFFALNVHELLIVGGEFHNNLVKQVSPENIFFIYVSKISLFSLNWILICWISWLFQIICEWQMAKVNKEFKALLSSISFTKAPRSGHEDLSKLNWYASCALNSISTCLPLYFAMGEQFYDANDHKIICFQFNGERWL
jgi:hypothetical protein